MSTVKRTFFLYYNYCSVLSIHCSVLSVNSVFTVQNSLFSIYCSFLTVQYSQFSITDQYSLFKVFTVHSFHYSQYSLFAIFTVHTIHCFRKKSKHLRENCWEFLCLFVDTKTYSWRSEFHRIHIFTVHSFLKISRTVNCFSRKKKQKQYQSLNNYEITVSEILAFNQFLCSQLLMFSLFCFYILFITRCWLDNRTLSREQYIQFSI